MRFNFVFAAFNCVVGADALVFARAHSRPRWKTSKISSTACSIRLNTLCKKPLLNREYCVCVCVCVYACNNQHGPHASDEEQSGFRYFRTSAYKLHYFETASGFRLVLNSAPNVADLRKELRFVYSLLVDYVIKNPEYTVNDKIQPDVFSVFVRELGTYLTAKKLLK